MRSIWAVAQVVLLALAVILPALVLVKGNSFTSRSRTFSRAILAVLAGWFWLNLVRFISVEVDFALATSEQEMERLAQGDGASGAAILLFGWVPALLIVTIVWTAVRMGRAIRGRTGGNRSGVPTA